MASAGLDAASSRVEAPAATSSTSSSSSSSSSRGRRRSSRRSWSGSSGGRAEAAATAAAAASAATAPTGKERAATVKRKNKSKRKESKRSSDASTWACSHCTFVNPGTELACTMCFNPRLDVVKELTVQWQWKADELWIAYDHPSVVEIEKAFTAGAKSVTLSSGFFADNGGYSIVFQRGPKSRFYQLNSGTGTRRIVRRLADDDANLYHPVAREDVPAEQNVCVVCQYEYGDEEEPDNHIVKLPVCMHTFHKACVKGWVNLHGACPTCKQAL